MCATEGQLIMVFIVIPLAVTACGVAAFIWALAALRWKQEKRDGRVWEHNKGFEGRGVWCLSTGRKS